MNVSGRVAGEEKLVGQLGTRGREGLITAPGADWAQDRKNETRRKCQETPARVPDDLLPFKVSGLGVSQ